MLIARFLVILSLLLLNSQVHSSVKSSRHLAITLELTAHQFDSVFTTNIQSNDYATSHSSSSVYPGLDVKIGAPYLPNIAVNYFKLSDSEQSGSLDFAQANLLFYYDYNILFSELFLMLDVGLDVTKLKSKKVIILDHSLYDISIPQETPNLYFKATFKSASANLYYGFYLINNLNSIEAITNELSGLFIKYAFQNNIDVELGYRINDVNLTLNNSDITSVVNQNIENQITYLTLSWNMITGEANISDNYVHLNASSTHQDQDNIHFIHPITNYPEFQQ